jgi:glycosyltransferase involved in cell wall biosynthesis
LDWQKWKIIFYYLERGGYSNASKIICVSPSTREIISAKYKIDQTVSLVVPNGINCQFNRNIVPEIKNNREILFVGRIDKRKGVDFLISAYEELIKNNPGILLHIVGEGKDRPKLQNYCLNKGLNIIFHGHLSDQEIFNLSKQASAQIIPSVFEGFGLVVLEAMSRGLPVIATNVDGIRDIITDGSNGILVDYGDKYLLAKRIQDLLINDDLAKRLVKNAYNSLENYKWENTYADTIHVYEELLS